MEGMKEGMDKTMEWNGKEWNGMDGLTINGDPNGTDSGT